MSIRTQCWPKLFIVQMRDDLAVWMVQTLFILISARKRNWLCHRVWLSDVGVESCSASCAPAADFE